MFRGKLTFLTTKSLISRCAIRRNSKSSSDSSDSECSDSSSSSDSDCADFDSYHRIKNTGIHATKRGTGGRSSFSGVVATVFGATGFLGRYVCNKLGKIGTQLIIPYRGTFDGVRRLKLVGDLGQVLFVPFQLNDPSTIEKCVQYSNVVINLIGRDWETKNYKFPDVHVQGPCDIAAAVKKAGIDTFIHISALNASKEPPTFMLKNGSEFLETKFQGEQAVKSKFPDAIIFRPSDMFGEEDRFVRYFSSGWRHHFKGLPLYKKGECTEKQPVFVGDVASAIVAACINKTFRGKTIQAVGPHRYLLSELVDWFHRIMRKDKDWGYRRYDMKYDPLFKLRVTLMPRLVGNWPVGHIHWEKVEREAISDKIDEDLPTLESMGVNVTPMEDLVPWHLRTYRLHSYAQFTPDEETVPNPPKIINRADSEEEAVDQN